MKTTSTLPLWALAAASLGQSDAHLDGNVLSRHYRGYNLHRPSYDLVTQMLKSPVPWNSLFEQQKQQWSRLPRVSTPHYSISDNETDMTLEVEIPGVLAKDVQVEVEDRQVLRINGSRHRSDTDDEFAMSFDLAKNVDADKMKVTLANGILTVMVPKRAPQVRRIDVVPVDTTEDKTKIPARNDSEMEKSVIESVDGLEITNED